jgi:hypothetical protein
MAKLVKSDYLWIADTDYRSDSKLSLTAMSGDADFTLAYTDSKLIDETEKSLLIITVFITINM